MQIKSKTSVVLFVVAIWFMGIATVNLTNWFYFGPELFWKIAPIANAQLTFMTVATAPIFGLKMRQISLLSDKLEHAVSHDQLTQVSTRHHLEELLQVENIWPCAVIIADLDRFKAINDTYGHPIGDRVLQHFASLVKEMIRQNDMIARYGGEEFLIILPHCWSQNGATRAQRICDRLASQAFKIGEHEIAVTASSGVSIAEGPADLPQAIDRADYALYAAKDAGRNQVRVAP